MKTIWAPWREKFIKNKKNSKKCVLCRKTSSKCDIKSLVVFKGRTCFVILNLYPYNNGHLMVVPYEHKKDLSELTKEEFEEMFFLVKKMVEVLKKTHKSDGFNIGINIGKCAGAGIDDHIHVHIVPRWFGDTNFITTISETKVISESLKKTFKLISQEVNKK